MRSCYAGAHFFMPYKYFIFLKFAPFTILQMVKKEYKVKFFQWKKACFYHFSKRKRAGVFSLLI